MPTTSTVQYIVVVPANNYFAIGYGLTMFNTDMIAWQANGTNSTAVELYSTGEVAPTIDAHQDYNTTFTFNSTHTTFISTRSLSTGDPGDFIIPTVSMRYNNCELEFGNYDVLCIRKHHLITGAALERESGKLLNESILHSTSPSRTTFTSTTCECDPTYKFY